MPLVNPSASNGATQDLSNLTSPTVIAVDLLPDPAVSVSLGSNAKRFDTLWANAVRVNGPGLFQDIVSNSTGVQITSGQLPDGSESAQIRLGSLSAIPLVTGNQGSANNSTSIQALTGNVLNGISGAVLLKTGAATGTGTRGAVILDGSFIDASGKNIKNAANPVDAQDLATKAYVLAQAGGSGANTTLSNLTSTSVNQTLKPATAYAVDVGTLVKPFGGVWTNYLAIVNNASGAPKSFGTLETTAGAYLPSGALQIGPFLRSTDATNYGVAIYSDSSNVSNTGKVQIETGVAGASGFNSGDINLRTGAAANIRGKITLDAVLNLPVQAAPTTPANGDMWFDGTSLKLRVAGVTRTVVLV